MNFLLLVPALDSIGGMQKRDRLLTRALDAALAYQGGTLVVLALNDATRGPGHPDLAALSVTRILRFGGNRAQFIAATLRLFPQVKSVLYGLLGFTPLVIGQRVVAPQSKRVLLIHGTDAWDNRGRVYEWATHQMHAVVPVSHYTLARYRQVYHIPASQEAFILPNSLEPHKIASMPTSQFADANPDTEWPRLLTVARLIAGEAGKGVDTVIRALPALLPAYPDLHYVVIGDGSDRPRLERLARDLQVRQAVDFRGFVPQVELDRAYATCTVYVMPSASEGFGLVFIEAMACGKPVVAARVGGAPEVVEDGVSGILVGFGDDTAVARAVSSLLADPGLRRRMGQAGVERVRQHYTYEVFCRRVAEMLPQLTPGHLRLHASAAAGE